LLVDIEIVILAKIEFVMSTEFKLPNIGEGVSEADIAEISVNVGDVIVAGQTVMELETEKAVVDLPCDVAGVVESVLVKDGDTIEVGQPLLVIAESNGAATTSSAPSIPAESATSAAAPKADATAVATESQAAPATSPVEIVTGKIDFVLPNLGEGITSADVAEIAVAVGDVIEADDGIMDLETEKAVVELPCPHSGKITALHVSEGDTIEVGQLVLTIESTSAVGSSSPDSAAPPNATANNAAPSAAPTSPTPPASTTKPSAPASVVPSTTVAKSTNSTGIPVPAAPSTRRLARQLGVDLERVNGSGRGGRITAEDVQEFVKGQMQNGNAISRGNSAIATSSGTMAAPPLPDFTKFGEVERERLNKLSRTAAENLTLSWNVIPHVTQHDKVDITDLEAARKKFGQGIGKNGPKVTMTAIIMKALTTCLQAYPKFNSSLDPETQEIVYKKYYNIGCAVDTPNGLLVPVVKDCDRKSILEIAADITELAGLARDRKLPVDSMQGATCTVTNLGGIGGVAFSPIVNYPEVCILGMSRGQKELKMIDGEIVERLMLPLSLSYDHRVVNGADAARFVVSLSNLLADPFQLLTTV